MYLFPTLAKIVKGNIPADRYVDDIDQTAVFLGKQENSNREGVILYMGADIYGVKWRNWKVMFKELDSATEEMKVYPTPRLYILLEDPGERTIVLFTSKTWVAEKALPQLTEHAKSF